MSLKVHVRKVYTDNLALHPDIKISQLIENCENCILRVKFREYNAYCFFFEGIKVSNEHNKIIKYPLSDDIISTDTLVIECYRLKSVEKM